MSYVSENGKGMSQTQRRLSYLTIRQQLADVRRTDDVPLALWRGVRGEAGGWGQTAHLYAQLPAISHLVVEAFLAVMPETIVIACQQHTHIHLVAQHLFHEFSGRQRL